MNGYIIPAGTVLVVPLYPLLNSPHVWDCPAEFRPVRHPSLPGPIRNALMGKGQLVEVHGVVGVR